MPSSTMVNTATLPPLPNPTTAPHPEIVQGPPWYYNTYGPNANCTLELCSVKLSVYEYRPKLAANAVFIALFGIALFAHLIQGLMQRTWTYSVLIAIGCLCEMIGYGGRIMLYQNPFSFTGFIMQIVCITIAPVFMTAAIYITLSRIVRYLAPSLARFRPIFYYVLFIPCDVISLVLQAVGGASSSSSNGSDKQAVDISISGLAFQVFTLVVFITLALDFAWRYYRASPAQIDGEKGQGMHRSSLTGTFKLFVLALSAAIILILIRCAYRIDELSDGYGGPLIHNEGLFIALEGAMILVAVYVLLISNPGFAMPNDLSVSRA